MNDSKPLLIFVCAYHQEALPLITYYKMKRNMAISHLAYYQAATIALIETGPGKLNAASSTSYIAGKYNIEQSAWLNIGIAGHRSLDIGDGIFCNKVSDEDTGENYYPEMSFRGKCSSHALLTVPSPETHYKHACLYDMEAAGIFSSVTRFTTLEHIHCYKIISDNLSQPVQNFNKDQTTKLISEQFTDIKTLAEKLIHAVSEYREVYQIPDEYYYFSQQSQRHFSVTQLTQLKTLIRRWRALSKQSIVECLMNEEKPNEKQNAKQLLQSIEKQIYKLNFPTNNSH